MRRALLLFVGVLWVSSATYAKAPPWTSTAIADKPQFAMQPDKAYILVEAPEYGVAITLMPRPSPEQLAADRADYEEAFAKAHVKWEKQLAQWQAATASRAAGAALPKLPEEPTHETFAWMPFERRNAVWMGPVNRFAKKGTSLYLQEVPPGAYIYYGSLFLNANGGVDGSCLCMGTIAFEAQAGKVTMLGRVTLPLLDAYLSLPKNQRSAALATLSEEPPSYRLSPATDKARDLRLPADLLVQAHWKPLARLPNWYGVTVARLAPIDGVFTYELDRQIDLGKPDATLR